MIKLRSKRHKSRNEKMWFCDKDLSSIDSINQETHKGTYMENIQEIYIYIYGIYKQYMGVEGRVGVGGGGYAPSPHPALYIPYIFHIYFLNIFHICSLVCFLIYGVNRRQVLIAKPRLYLFSDFTPFIFISNLIILG